MRKKRITAAALSLVMAAALSAGAFAATPTVTFNNIKEAQPDLYVTKSVSSAVEGYYAPDAEFTFVLKWDKDGDGVLEFAENAGYYVYDEYGSQVAGDTGSYTFHTSATGRFTLKAGQTAKFEWAGQIDYEVYEDSGKAVEGFTQVLPAGGGSATGTVAADGTMVEFENRYVPEVEGEETQLAVYKDVSWPDGYETPDFGTEFTFEITLDGKAYAGQPYKVYDAYMEEQLGSGTTDTAGRFSIKAGQTALFEGIETNLDYAVREVELEEGWRQAGKESYEGSTTAPLVYTYFTNAGASFIVEKDRSDGITGLDDEFTFVLADGNGDPMEGAEYYLYENGSLEGGPYSTDAEGRFTLKAGQRAVFFGIGEGTDYHIEEDLTDEGADAPEGGSSEGGSSVGADMGHQGNQGGGSGPTRTNAVDENLTATATDAAGDNPARQASLVYAGDPNDSLDSDAGGALAATATDSEGNCTASVYVYDGEGEGSASALENVVLTELLAGEPGPDQTYSTTLSFDLASGWELVSVDVDTGTITPKGDGAYTWEFAVSASMPTCTINVVRAESESAGAKNGNAAYTVDAEEGYEGTVSYDETPTWTFVNTQLSNLTVKKLAGGFRDKTLEGASFTLYRLDEGEYKEVETLTTGEDGTLTFAGLEAGSYKLVETEAPEGYNKYTEEILIDLPVTMTEDEVTAEKVDVGSEEFTGLYGDGVYWFYDVTYDVYDSLALMELPNTGGYARLIVIMAIAGCAVAGFSVFWYRRQKNLQATGGAA